jgi:hypothetical protein
VRRDHGPRLRNLVWDLLVFVEILLYWPFALLVMLPARWLDRRLGSSLFERLDRLTRVIAGA